MTEKTNTGRKTCGALDPGAGRDPLRRRHYFVTPRLDRGAQVIRSRRAATQTAVVCADAQDSIHLDPAVKPRDDK